MSQTPRRSILVVDDEPEIRVALSQYLKGEGFTVGCAADGAETATALSETQIDLVLLDLGLRNESGMDLLKNIISRTEIAVIILTGKTDPIERVVGLELGADDYIAKPFLQRELLARINAVLRRTKPMSVITAGAASNKPRNIHFNHWRLDTRLRKVQTDDGERIDLTGTEFDLLAALAHKAGEALSRDELSMIALNRAWEPRDRSVDIHIYNLRKKLAKDTRQEPPIVTVRNFGYALSAVVNSSC